MMQQAPMAQAAAPAPRGRGRGRAPGGGGRGRGRGAASTALVAADPFAAAQPQRLPPEQRGEVSWDIRTKISTNCEKMNSKETSQVIAIIRRVMPSIGNDNGEIELDMNALDNTTLWTLWDFFEDNAAAREAAEPATSAKAKGKRRR